MVLLIISWLIATIIQAYFYFIRESIRNAVEKGQDIMGALPLLMWNKNRLITLKLIAIIFPLILLIITYSQYGFWTGIIIGIISTMVAFALGKGRVIYLSS